MENVAAILPPLCLAMIYTACCAGGQASRETPLRRSLLFAAVIWGVLLVGITELSSLLGLVIYGWLALSWGIVLIGSGLVLIGRLSQQRRVHLFSIPRVPRFLEYLIFSIVTIILLEGFIAVVAPPNTWDSMTYHMSRVAHWIQDQNVGFYPTNIERQLHQSPWAEFAIAHLQILAQSDRWANLVQWFSMIGSVLGITLIAQELGADARGQILAAVVAATMPMGILQASGTQNNLVVGFWLIGFAYFALVSRMNLSWSNTLGAGCSLGLALLSKATAFVFAFPFVIWLGLSWLKSFSWERCKSIFVIGIIAITINLGQLQRNFALYASPLGPSGEGMSGDFTYLNEVIGFSTICSNVIRNIGVHIGTPFGPVNQVIEQGIAGLHKYVLSVNLNDSRTTWTGTQFHIVPTSNSEDAAGNPLHLALIVYAIAFFLGRRDSSERVLFQYLTAVCTSFLLFAAVFKWQPWHSRLHIPFFLLSAPFVGIALSKIPTQKYVNWIAVLLIILSLPWVVYNSSRPLIGGMSILTVPRMDQYFRTRPALQIPYEKAVDFVRDRGCSAIGLSLGGDDWEYPFWVLMQESGIVHFRVEHVRVQTQSAVLNRMSPFDSFTPCAIIALDNNPPIEITLGRNVFAKEAVYGPVSLFIAQSQY